MMPESIYRCGLYMPYALFNESWAGTEHTEQLAQPDLAPGENCFINVWIENPAAIKTKIKTIIS